MPSKKFYLRRRSNDKRPNPFYHLSIPDTHLTPDAVCNLWLSCSQQRLCGSKVGDGARFQVTFGYLLAANLFIGIVMRLGGDHLLFNVRPAVASASGLRHAFGPINDVDDAIDGGVRALPRAESGMVD